MDDSDIEFFEEALAEEGVEDVTIEHYRDSVRQAEIIHVKKYVNGEKIGVEEAITIRELIATPDKKQLLATRAAMVARKFRDFLTEKHQWGENVVLFELVDDNSVTCLHCRAEASMEDIKQLPVQMSETAVPNPTIEYKTSYPEAKIRMTLLALLKGECDPRCPNSPDDRKI